MRTSRGSAGSASLHERCASTTAIYASAELSGLQRRFAEDNDMGRKQKNWPYGELCLPQLSCLARQKRVGVLWGFGRNPGCRASGDHHTRQFVIDVASCVY